METTVKTAPITNRYEFVLLFDVVNGNPNGDPDAGNAPRTDAETGHGLVTDVCLKRKIRDYVALAHSDEDGFGIFIRQRANLNTAIAKAHEETGGMPPFDSKAKRWKTVVEKVGKAAAWMCQNFYDVRTFGSVMSTGPNAGQIRGPVQLAFGHSVDRIAVKEIGMTRVAVSDNSIKGADVGSTDFAKWEKEQPEDQLRTMGSKSIVPYGLYRSHGFVSAALAPSTGFSEDDLQVLWQALANMFEHDRSAARGEMATRKLFVFKHASKLGNAPAHKLFDLIRIERIDDSKPPRAFSDYKVTVDREGLPDGVQLTEMV